MVAGSVAQLLKVITFLIAEKKVNYRRFVQSDGMPNLHTTAMSALAVAVGFEDGFDSLVFTLAMGLLVLVTVDTMNVKNAKSRQAEAIMIILDRLRHKEPGPPDPRRLFSYTPVDLFSGVVVGVALALLIL